MKKVSVFVVILCVIIGVSQGCMEEPNPVGSRILPPSDLLQLDTTTIFAAGNSTILAQSNTSSQFNTLVGKSDGYESWALIRFTPVPDSLLFTELLDAEIQLRTVYHFGDSLAPLSFDVHKALVSWESDSLTIDRLQEPGFYEPLVSSSFSMSTVGDTATISIPIDTSLVRLWINAVLDTANTNFGVLLRPTNSGVIKGFATNLASNTAWYPKLVARYTRSGSTTVDTVRLSGSSSAFAAFTTNPVPPNDNSRIYVQNGIALRGAVDFDISSLPPRATIHKAVLELTLDPLASQLNSQTRDSVNAFYVDTTGAIVSILAVSDPATVSGQKVYRLSVTRAVQLWTRRTALNRLLLSGYAESYALDAFVFYGVESNFRPKLTITYSRVQ